MLGSTPPLSISQSVPSFDADAVGLAFPDLPTASPPGFLLLDVIGRGGMGVVYRARDVALGREVAIKILSDRYPRGSTVAARFVEEAHITGQLQHPGIPAVHHTGTLPDGRPFLAMKLIKGRTLDDLLKQRRDLHADHGKYLAVFEAIGHAVGYAHSLNIIHRDLKPQNVMVGAFGEVQVMDWGLAKVAGESGSDFRVERDGKREGEIRSPRRSDDATRTGSILGTPAYMPPEQAVGAVERIDARSDVFGLGAILCVILTGHPPYFAADSDSTRQLAEAGKLDAAFARLDAIDAEPELVALCKRCLSVERSNRPKDGGEVAAAVAHLRAAAEDRARTAELDRRAAEVRAAEDRKRRRVLAAAAGIVASVFAIGTGISVWQAVRADEQAAEAIREKERADTQYRQARLTLLRMLDAFDDKGAESIPQVIELRRKQSEQALAFFESIGAGRDGADPQQRADLAVAYKEAARLQMMLGQNAPAEQNLRRAIRLLEDLNVEGADDPGSRGNLAVCYDLLGVLLGSDLPARGEEAAACGRKAVAMGERLVRDFPTEVRTKHILAQACDNLGTLYRRHPGGSVVELYERSQNLLRELHRAQPEQVEFAVGLAETCSNLGSVYLGKNQPDKAAAVYQEALEILEPLAVARSGHVRYASSLASLRINLGSLWLTQRRAKDALQQYDLALAALQDILRREPNHAQVRGDLLPAHGGRAQALGLLGRPEEAVKDWDRVVELAPAANRPTYRLQRASVLIQVGDLTKAAAEIDAVAGEPTTEAAHLFEAGRLHSRIAAALYKSPSRAEDHATRAVAWLKKAHENGFFKTRIEAGSLDNFDFANLKKRADFQKLLRDVAETLPKVNR